MRLVIISSCRRLILSAVSTRLAAVCFLLMPINEKKRFVAISKSSSDSYALAMNGLNQENRNDSLFLLSESADGA